MSETQNQDRAIQLARHAVELIAAGKAEVLSNRSFSLSVTD